MILFSADVRGWQLDTLRLLGYTSDDWETISRFPVSIRNHVVTDLKNANTNDHEVCREDFRWTASQYKCNIQMSVDADFPNRIFLSKQNYYRRRIENIGEVMEVLHEYGFETYQPEQLDIADQVRLFSQAEMVFGAISSGFANIIFGDGLDVVCVYPPGPWIPGIFFAVANALGHDWYPLFSHDVQSQLSKAGHFRDVTIDVDKLRHALERALNE